MTNLKLCFEAIFGGIAIGNWLMSLAKNDPLWLIGAGLFAIAAATAL